MNLKYEPASVPQHISVKWLFRTKTLSTAQAPQASSMCVPFS